MKKNAFRLMRAILVAMVMACAYPAVSSAQDAPASAGYVTWTDPLEQAFSIEMPAQWRVTGGMYRFGALDARPEVEAVAPNGQMAVFYGDKKTPTFAVPSPYLAAQGLKAGDTFNLGTGPVLVAAYVPGTAISELLAKNHAPCVNAAITGRNARPDAVGQVNAITQQFGAAGIQARTDAGEVTFNCGASGGIMNGYTFAASQLVTSQAVGFWSVPFMFGLVAVPGQEGLAGAVTLHMLSTFRLNPKWVAQQQGTFARTNQIVEATNHAITDMVWKSWNINNGTQGPEAFAKAQLGVQDVNDPDRGPLRISNDHSYNWICSDGSITGNETGAAPADVNCRALQPLP